jgi:lipopolysaccharide transport system permease protein
LGELWQYRELVYFLAWRDIIVRYKQTALGVTWAIIQPFFTMVIFSLFFGALAQIPSDGVPYPVFTFTALVPWTFFANGLTQASNSLVGSANLIKKVYFPRLAVPIAVVLAGLPDLALSFLVLLVMIYYYGITPHWLTALWLPAFVLMAVMTSLGVGLWLAALNVQYRDVRYVIGFLTQLWLFATPVAYPARLVPEKWQALYGINPMVGVIEGFRWAVLGTNNPPARSIAVSALTSLLMLLSGLYYFRRMERTFADLA